VSERDHILGPLDAPATLVEYTGYTLDAPMEAVEEASGTVIGRRR
jgi:hypothetical protein